jgi:hypothetical protein
MPPDTIAHLIEQEERGLQLPGCLSEFKDHTGHGTSTVVELKVFVKNVLKGKRKLKANGHCEIKRNEKNI